MPFQFYYMFAFAQISPTEAVDEEMWLSQVAKTSFHLPANIRACLKGRNWMTPSENVGTNVISPHELWCSDTAPVSFLIQVLKWWLVCEFASVHHCSVMFKLDIVYWKAMLSNVSFESSSCLSSKACVRNFVSEVWNKCHLQSQYKPVILSLSCCLSLLVAKSHLAVASKSRNLWLFVFKKEKKKLIRRLLNGQLMLLVEAGFLGTTLRRNTRQLLVGITGVTQVTAPQRSCYPGWLLIAEVDCREKIRMKYSSLITCQRWRRCERSVDGRLVTLYFAAIWEDFAKVLSPLHPSKMHFVEAVPFALIVP